MEPIFLEPVYKHNVWGGYKISQELKEMQKMQIAESWEVAANKNGDSIVKNGVFKGKTLKEIFRNKEIRISIFGQNCRKMKKFPLLIKFIDAKQNLSVQVHPNNFYARKFEQDTGKTEMWYIIDCKEDAKIICGLKDSINSKKDLENINKDSILQHLNYIPIKKGDAIFIDAGTIHAIMEDTLICEIQQNSDLTYRVYDWGRNDKSRVLHLKKAKKVINLRKKLNIKHCSNQKNTIEKIFHNHFFCVDKINIEDKLYCKSNKKTFQAMNVIKGVGKITFNGKSYEIKAGTSFLIPANLGKYMLEGDLKILMSYISKKI